ncbi:MAG: hypothetical protein U0821_19000 [Chloroflexota bacterium]
MSPWVLIGMWVFMVVIALLADVEWWMAAIGGIVALAMYLVERERD